MAAARNIGGILVAALGLIVPDPAMAQPARSIDRGVYTDRLHGMWLGECIANWTGLRTEGLRTAAPFLTDADWGTTPPGGQYIDFVLDQDPWRADDDTDIEYVYLHLMDQRGRCALTGNEIRNGWRLHMGPEFIWVSNRRAWDLMGLGLTPPATGMPAANPLWAFIDAQLTTELFGALCPGMPEEALKYAWLPMRATSAGFATHAAQFYAVLFSLAGQVPPSVSEKDRAVWLVREARRWIPTTSKSADIVDFVLADFLSNPDPDDWERTRDRVYQRYQVNAAANGFEYRAWFESSVNFASGVMCLLYGRCDYKRTVQIGTLSGWDSDNATATMGGLIGLMLGHEALVAQFPGRAFSDRFDINRTRLNLPDRLPGDPQAQDTLLMMAQRSAALVDRTVVAAGGSVDAVNNRWLLPAPVAGAREEWNPMRQVWRRSANNRVRAAGASVTCWSSAAANIPGPSGVYGVADPAWFGNGYEHDAAGRDREDERGYFYSTMGSGQPPGTPQELRIEYGAPVEVATVRFIEGDHLTEAGGYPVWQRGGWFNSLVFEVKVGGQWVAAAGAQNGTLDPNMPFEVIDWVLAEPVVATGVRVVGPSGGPGGFVTCAELDALGPEVPVAADPKAAR